MKNNKQLIIWGIIVLLAFIAFLFYNHESKENVTIKEKTTAPKVGEVTPVIEIEEERKMAIEEEFPSSMPEYAIQNAIHGMSHQKVHAKEKWGFLPMTQERIGRLRVVIEENKSSYENAETYLKILNRWSKNDFTQADADHNAIWTLQGGNVGRATRVLTFEEEKEFIKKHFNIEIKDVRSD